MNVIAPKILHSDGIGRQYKVVWLARDTNDLGSSHRLAFTRNPLTIDMLELHIAIALYGENKANKFSVTLRCRLVMLIIVYV